MKFIFVLSLPLYALDQLTKSCVLRFIKPDEHSTVIAGFFDLVNITNTGAAFGSFKNNNTFFVVISCLALLALLFVILLLVRRRSRDAWRDISLALLLAGVLGNLADRLLYGHVVDFLLFDLHIPFAHPWPAFNVADSCISIAVVCFIIHSFRQKDSARLPEKL
jgi:signal peptidase II